MIVLLKTVATAVGTKAIFMATMLYFVLTSHLTDFEKGLIIAGVSAFITGIFTVIGAVLAAKMAEQRVAPIAQTVEEIHTNVHDVARSVGTDRRETDNHQEATE